MGELVLTQEYLLLDSESVRHRVVLIASDALGEGEPELGRDLMRRLMAELASAAEVPGAVVLYHAGVRLTAAETPTLASLSAMARRGTEILVCRQSLGHYGMELPKGVGRAVDMKEIADCLMKAETVVRP